MFYASQLSIREKQILIDHAIEKTELCLYFLYRKYYKYYYYATSM